MDLQTLHAVIANRYDVLANYAKSLKRTYIDERRELQLRIPPNARVLRDLKRRLEREDEMLDEAGRREFAEVLSKSRALQTAYSMRRELVALWARSTAPREQLVKQLQDWCQRAEASGVQALIEFSRRLRSYA